MVAAGGPVTSGSGGREGDRDRIIFPARNGPIVLNGDTWIYYNANSYLHTAWSQEEYLAQSGGDARGSSNCFLAKMPEDHWVSLDAGSSEGFLVAKPWGPPQEILLNADAVGGSVEVELLSPYGEPIPNFTRRDCVPITANGKDQQVKWKSGRSPLEFGEDYRGGVLAKFYLKNAKLYSYTFTLPDPDGRLDARPPERPLERDHHPPQRRAGESQHRSRRWPCAGVENPDQALPQRRKSAARQQSILGSRLSRGRGRPTRGR